MAVKDGSGGSKYILASLETRLVRFAATLPSRYCSVNCSMGVCGLLSSLLVVYMPGL
jgi:hypothetical protein